MIHKADMIVFSCFLGLYFLNLGQSLPNQQTDKMKKLAWICILALVFCACRKDKDDENYEVPSEQITLTNLEFETALG